MISGSSKPLAPLGAPPEQFEPSPEQLALPADALTGASAVTLLRTLQQAQEAGIKLNELFDDRFEGLVTEGQAEKYAALVDRFKAKYATCSENLTRIARAFGDVGQPSLAALVEKVAEAEATRQTLWLDVQVLRQHLSMSAADDIAKEEVQQKLTKARQDVQAQVDIINETMEDLRCEVAELE